MKVIDLIKEITKNQIKPSTVIILSPVPSKKPMKAPKAAFNTPSLLPSLLIHSPIKAPKKGPRIIPQGPVKKPRIRPIVAPLVAYLLPPNFFVMVTGKKLSAIETTTAITAVIIRQISEISLKSEK